MYDRARKKRLSMGLTMKNVADMIGVSEATVSRYETGKQKLGLGPGLKLLKALGLVHLGKEEQADEAGN